MHRARACTWRKHAQLHVASCGRVGGRAGAFRLFEFELARRVRVYGQACSRVVVVVLFHRVLFVVFFDGQRRATHGTFLLLAHPTTKTR